MSTTIGVGILGLGRSGWGIHAAAISGHDGFEVVAVADPEPERRAEAVAEFGCTAYPEPEGVIADDRVELVVVATPSQTHVPLALSALSGGRHVVVEKPMAQEVAGVDRMIAAADRAGRVLTCYQPRRLDPDFLAIRELVRSGRLGEPLLVRRTIHDFTRRRDWQTLRRFDGGMLSNTAPHLLDQVLQFADPDTDFDLLADLRHTVGAGDAEDHVLLVLRPKGAAGPLLQVEASSAVAIAQPAWFVVGTAGTVSGSAPELTVRWSDPASWQPLSLDEGPAPERRYGSRETLCWDQEQVGGAGTGRSVALAFYDNLAAAVREGAELLITAGSIRRQIGLLARARRQTGFR
ncbi:MAG: Gfo/Idh/MocA family oxidoreductase [Microlunatus sp.]|nr:Gfo/Idh/MocA family oxidoreductase [Microlunatus sp.]